MVTFTTFSGGLINPPVILFSRFLKFEKVIISRNYGKHKNCEILNDN